MRAQNICLKIENKYERSYIDVKYKRMREREREKEREREIDREQEILKSW